MNKADGILEQQKQNTDENKNNVSDVFDKVMNSDIIEDIIKYEIV